MSKKVIWNEETPHLIRRTHDQLWADHTARVEAYQAGDRDAHNGQPSSGSALFISGLPSPTRSHGRVMIAGLTLAARLIALKGFTVSTCDEIDAYIAFLADRAVDRRKAVDSVTAPESDL